MDNYDNIYIDDNILKDSYQTYNNLVVGFPTMSSDINKSGDINREANLFGDEINRISNQSSSISFRYRSVGNIVKDSIDEWNLLEKKMAREASSIIIPKLEKLNKSIVDYNYRVINLSKDDGKGVNLGQTTNLQHIEEKELFDKKDLNSILNSNNNFIHELDNRISIEKENLRKIDNSNGNEVQQLDDNSSISKEQLKNFNNLYINETQHLDDNLSINKEQLNEMNSKYIDEIQQLDDYEKQLIGNNDSESDEVLEEELLQKRENEVIENEE